MHVADVTLLTQVPRGTLCFYVVHEGHSVLVCQVQTAQNINPSPKHGAKSNKGTVPIIFYFQNTQNGVATWIWATGQR